MKNIYVTEETLTEAVAYLNNEITFFGFLSHTKAFLKELLINPLNADTDEYLKEHGMDRKTLINALLEKSIVEKETKIEDKNGSDKFLVSYKIPKRNFERKMRRLYSALFEKNEIQESILSEEGMGGGGAATCGSVMQAGGANPGSGQYVTRFGSVQRREIYNTGKKKRINDSMRVRKIYVTEEQAKILQEMGTQDAGNYQYDVPMNFNGGNDPAYDHKNMIAKSFPKKKKKKQ